MKNINSPENENKATENIKEDQKEIDTENINWEKPIIIS